MLRLSARGAVRVLTLDAPPVNPLGVETLRQLRGAIAEAEADPAARALVITSSAPKVFSAGLDLTELADPDPARLRRHWRAMQTACHALFTTRLATVAQIGGHAPAGGCILAMACDHRVMRGDAGATIGLNEVWLGLPPPWWIAELMCRLVGPGPGERLLQTGALLPADEALRVGLVDEVAAGVLGDRGCEAAEQWLRVPDRARALVKAERRGALGAAMLERLEQDCDWFAETLCEDGVQALLMQHKR